MNRSDLDRGIINIGNLYRFNRKIAKLQRNEPVTIAFIGGSITQDCNTTTHELCYAYRVYDWFLRQFPSCKIKYINAGIGATGSDFGMARVEEDVLSYNPDIIFAEFSVNDVNNYFYKETFEQFIRKILIHKCEPALFMFNNVFYDSGYNAQEVHNEIGLYYDLPIVSMKDSVYEEILLGKFESKNITTDNLHPNNTGHGLLADVIINLLEIIMDKCREGNVESSYIIKEKYLTSDKYFNIKRYRNEIFLSGKTVSSNCLLDDSEQYGVKDCFKKGIIFDSNNAILETELEFKGLFVQYKRYCDRKAPKCNLYIDEKLVDVLDGNFDEDWGDCLYMKFIAEYDDNKTHKLKFEIEQFDSIINDRFYLVSVITY